MQKRKKTVMVFGTFDIFHKGHENFLEQARQYGDYLIVVVARDEIVKKVKGKRPKNDEILRLGTLKQLADIDRAILGSRSDMYKRIREIKPDIICLGYDQTAFTEKLQEKLNQFGLSHIQIVKLKPFKPKEFKSSKLK